jgi:hypothetical protein
MKVKDAEIRLWSPLRFVVSWAVGMCLAVAIGYVAGAFAWWWLRMNVL